MSLSLKLQLNPDNLVVVTNSINQQRRKTTLSFIQKITKSSLDFLIQYKSYEILINAQNIWNQIENFDFQAESAEEIRVERKFKEMMTPGNYIQVTEYDEQQYKKALSILKTYNPQTGIARTARVIRKLEEFNWEVVDRDCDRITMFNHEKDIFLFIPNNHDMSQETLAKVINKAKLSISDFFYPA